MVYTRRLADPNLKEDLPFRHYTLKHHLIACAGSDGRRNTIQCIDSTMIPAGEPSLWLYSVKT